MKRSFVRILWGDFLHDKNPKLKDYEKEYEFVFNAKNKILTRRFKIDVDMQRCLGQQFQLPFVVYTFGEENHKQLIGRGIESKLIHAQPYKYNPIKGLYRHKLDAYKYMMEDFDEVVFLDWDTYLDKELPADFWNILNKKESLQAALGHYRTPRINYRSGFKENRIIPTGAFVYMRDKSIPDKLIELNKDTCTWSCEPAMARLTDEMTGGWKGIKKYWELFEPEFYTNKRTPYKGSAGFIKPNLCFKNGFEEERDE